MAMLYKCIYRLFADDIHIHKPIHALQDHHALQDTNSH